MERAVFWLVVLVIVAVVLETHRRVSRYRRRIKEHPTAISTALAVVGDLARLLDGDKELPSMATAAAVSKLGYCRVRLRPPARGRVERIHRTIHKLRDNPSDKDRAKLRALVDEFLRRETVPAGSSAVESGKTQSR